MKKLLQHIKKIIVLVVSLQILNTGLFAQDFHAITNDQNVINSVNEYIAEIILNKVNFFPEHHQHGSHNHHKNSHSSLFKIQQYVLYKHTPATTCFVLKEQVTKSQYASAKDAHLENIVYDITPPPPKA